VVKKKANGKHGNGGKNSVQVMKTGDEKKKRKDESKNSVQVMKKG
jgi:hypothetical protein